MFFLSYQDVDKYPKKQKLVTNRDLHLLFESECIQMSFKPKRVRHLELPTVASFFSFGHITLNVFSIFFKQSKSFCSAMCFYETFEKKKLKKKIFSK
jgi:hypothetical protein